MIQRYCARFQKAGDAHFSGIIGIVSGLNIFRRLLENCSFEVNIMMFKTRIFFASFIKKNKKTKKKRRTFVISNDPNR